MPAPCQLFLERMETDGSNLYASLIDGGFWVFEKRETQDPKAANGFITTTDPDDPTIYRTDMTNADGLILTDPETYDKLDTLPDDIVHWASSTIPHKKLKEHGYIALQPLV